MSYTFQLKNISITDPLKNGLKPAREKGDIKYKNLMFAQIALSLIVIIIILVLVLIESQFSVGMEKAR